MTYKEIQELIKLVNKTDLAEVKIKQDDFEIAIRSKFFHKSSNTIVSAPAPSFVAPPAPVQEVTQAAPATAPVGADASKATSDEASSSGNYLEVRSPIVGTFYRSPGPDKGPFVKVGDTIEVGSVVCIVEAMKLFNEIESEIGGKIVKVMVEDASPVEYDQVLFLVEPA